MKRLLSGLALRLWLPVVLICLWQLLLFRSHNPFFPPPSQIFGEFGYVLTPTWIKTSFVSSMIILGAGFAIGSLLGILFGAILGESEVLREIFTPITNFFRSIPSVAKVPVLMALLGIGTFTRLSSVSLAVMFPVLMATMRAVATTEIHLLELSRILNYGRMRTLMMIRLPAATGEILTGLHAAVQVAILVMVVSEMLGSGIGIGAFIIKTQSTFMIADMWVGIIIVGTLGLLLNGLFIFAERRVAPWYFREKGFR